MQQNEPESQYPVKKFDMIDQCTTRNLMGGGGGGGGVRKGENGTREGVVRTRGESYGDLWRR